MENVIVATTRRSRSSASLPPVDAVKASASGRNPRISAHVQIRRVGAERDICEDDVTKLVDQNTDSSAHGVFGEPPVNVLRLNLALDYDIGREE